MGTRAQMIFQRALAIVGVNLRAKRFVLHHDVEDVAQHFVSHDIGFRAHRCGAGIKIQTSHFAEKIAGTQRSNRIAIVEVHGSVDGDGAVAGFFLANILATIHQRAGEALEESFGAALGFYVRDGRGNGNFRGAFHDVKRGGPKFAFAADDFTVAVAAFHDGAAIQFQKCAGDTLEYRNLQKFFGVETHDCLRKARWKCPRHLYW